MIKLFKIFKKTFQILEKKFIRNIIFLIFLTLISGVLEILSIGLILPILTVFVENDFYKYSNFFPLILNLSENQIFIIFFIIIFNYLYIQVCIFNIYHTLSK